MNLEIRKSLISFIENNLNWDLIEGAKKLLENPDEFEKFFKTYHSKEVYEILFENKIGRLPLYININDNWLKLIAEWKLKNEE